MRHHIQGPDKFYPQRRWEHHRGNKIGFGIIVVILGVFLLLRKFGYFFMDFNTLWPLALIAIGLMIGIRSRFHRNAWWILMLIGICYSIPEFEINGVNSYDLMIPVGLIIGGLIIAINSSRKKKPWKHMQVVTSNENMVNIDVTFGGRKEVVTSKEFRGANISTTFGGVELNLLQADSTIQPMVINLQVSFGGVELIVPSHWELQNEIDPSFGSVEDHRGIRTASNTTTEEKKILILRGNCSFGSVEIKSY